MTCWGNNDYSSHTLLNPLVMCLHGACYKSCSVIYRHYPCAQHLHWFTWQNYVYYKRYIIDFFLNACKPQPSKHHWDRRKKRECEPAGQGASAPPGMPLHNSVSLIFRYVPWTRCCTLLAALKRVFRVCSIKPLNLKESWSVLRILFAAKWRKHFKWTLVKRWVSFNCVPPREVYLPFFL